MKSNFIYNSIWIVIAALASSMAFADVHPGLKDAIDTKDYKKAFVLVNKMNVTSKYCPGTLPWTEAKKIYGNFFNENPSAMETVCDPEFVAAYDKNSCNAKDEIPLCVYRMRKVDVANWEPFLEKIQKNKLYSVDEAQAKDGFNAILHDLYVYLNKNVESPFDYDSNNKKLMEYYRKLAGSGNEFESEAGLMAAITKQYSEVGDVADKLLLKACRIYPDIDKKYEKSIDYALFSCADVFAKYVAVCSENSKGTSLVVPSTLSNKDTVFYTCDGKQWGTQSLMEKEYGYCTSKIAGEKHHVKDGYFICKNDKWVSVDELEYFTYGKACDVKSKGEKNIKNKKNNAAYVCHAGKWYYAMTLPNGKNVDSEKIGNYVWNIDNVDVVVNNSACPANDKANCRKYGRLYSYESAEIVCPEGWGLPTDVEWNDLVANLKGWHEADRSNQFGNYPGAFKDENDSFKEGKSANFYWLEKSSTRRTGQVIIDAGGVESGKIYTVEHSNWFLPVRCVKK